MMVNHKILLAVIGLSLPAAVAQAATSHAVAHKPAHLTAAHSAGKPAVHKVSAKTSSVKTHGAKPVAHPATHAKAAPLS